MQSTNAYILSKSQKSANNIPNNNNNINKNTLNKSSTFVIRCMKLEHLYL